MPSPLRVPRVNNNDDNVRVVDLGVKEGDFVRSGQVVGTVETDKAVLDVPAEQEGFVLKILHRTGDSASVGSVLLWLGAAADECIPEEPSAAPPRSAEHARPTAKAQAMLQERGLDPRSIQAAGERLTAADIEAWVARHPAQRAGGAGAAARTETPPDVPGEYRALSAEEHGMFAAVLWHRDRAAPAYLEIEYDPQPWESHAAAYAQQNRLMLPPLLALLAFRLVELARANPRINATLVGERAYQYRPVNLGFTVQAGQTLYLAVVRDAHEMGAARFIDALGEVQRHAMAHKLSPAEATGATIAFSSMARWSVSRHVPVLPSLTSLIVAHAASRAAGNAVLGASYDHRLLSGFDVAQVLQALAQTPQ